MRLQPFLLVGLSSAVLLSSGPSVRPPRPKLNAIPKTVPVKPPKQSPAPKQTYKGGDGTRYYAGEAYQDSGLPKVDRSQGAKQSFLRKKGLTKAPPGTEVDHIIPLSKGGPDTPQNMELLTKEQHRQKTAQERHK